MSDCQQKIKRKSNYWHSVRKSLNKYWHFWRRWIKSVRETKKESPNVCSRWSTSSMDVAWQMIVWMGDRKKAGIKSRWRRLTNTIFFSVHLLCENEQIKNCYFPLMSGIESLRFSKIFSLSVFIWFYCVRFLHELYAANDDISLSLIFAYSCTKTENHLRRKWMNWRRRREQKFTRNLMERDDYVDSWIFEQVICWRMFLAWYFAVVWSEVRRRQHSFFAFIYECSYILDVIFTTHTIIVFHDHVKLFQTVQK